MSTFGNIRSILSSPTSVSRDLSLWDALLDTKPSTLEQQGISIYVNDHLTRRGHHARFERGTYHDALFRGDYSSIVSPRRRWDLRDGFFARELDVLSSTRPPIAIVTDEVRADAHLIAMLLMQCDLSELRCLSLRDYNDDLLALLKVLSELELPSLRALDLSQNPSLCDLHIRELADASWFPSLVRLDLSNTSITDDACRVTSAGERLAFFGLAHTGITDEGLAELIDVHRGSLRGLDAMGTSMTEYSLPAILWGEFAQDLQMLRLGSELPWSSEAWCDFFEGANFPALQDLGVSLAEENSSSASLIAKALTSSSCWPNLERLTTRGPTSWSSMIASQARSCKQAPTLTSLDYRLTSERTEELDEFFATEILGNLEELSIVFGPEPPIEYDGPRGRFFYDEYVVFDRSHQIDALIGAFCMQTIKRVKLSGEPANVSEAIAYLFDPRAQRVIRELECDVKELVDWRLDAIRDKHHIRALERVRFTGLDARMTWDEWVEREDEEDPEPWI